MDILTQKRITDNGEGAGYFRNCIDYVYKKKPDPGEALIETKGYGVCDTNADHTFEQMAAVKDYYGKTGDNPVMHWILSFDKKTVQDADIACKYTEEVVSFFDDNYQVITGVHQEDQGGSLYHAHIVLNSVDVNTGKLYHSGRKELSELSKHIYGITGNYCKTEIKKSGDK